MAGSSRQYRARGKEGALCSRSRLKAGSPASVSVLARRDDGGPKRKETQEDGRDVFLGGLHPISSEGDDVSF